MMNKRLVILTTHFGCNFSGGSRATCEIFSRLEGRFEEIIVVCNRVGEHPFYNIQVKTYKNWLHAFNILNKLNKDQTVFYGDFYNAFLFVLLNIPFYFTYHDNWPELAGTSSMNQIRSLFYNPVYELIFRKATAIFTVSSYRAHYLKKYNANVYLVRNGINLPASKSSETMKSPNNSILMVGNIDKRKYIKAIELFTRLKHFDGTVHIYGNIINQNIAHQLQQFYFVKLIGYKDQIPYDQYSLLLHTSLMENLSMVWCEALAAGLPIVSFDVGGAREVIHNNNGMLIPPYDIDAMKNAMLDIILGNIQINPVKEMSQFSWDVASKQYQKLMCA